MSAFNRALMGLVAWVAFVVARVSDLRDEGWSRALLLFAALVLVPLALELLADEEESAPTDRWFRLASALQLPAALLLAVASWLPAGGVAGAAALPWVLLTFLFAAIGVVRLRQGGLAREMDRLCADVALGFSAVGGVWVLADRTGYSPLGFSPAIVSLTAVHFHYSGLILPLVAGLVQRELFFLRLSSRAAVGVILGVPAVAVGITATQLGWGMSLERAAACGLALAGMAVAILQVRIALEGRLALGSRVLLGIGGASLFIGMVFAVVYALRGIFAGTAGLDLPQMRLIHGTVNALGFALCSVLGWRRVGRERGAKAPGAAADE
jgi:hypothetical protein